MRSRFLAGLLTLLSTFAQCSFAEEVVIEDVVVTKNIHQGFADRCTLAGDSDADPHPAQNTNIVTSSGRGTLATVAAEKPFRHPGKHMMIEPAGDDTPTAGWRLRLGAGISGLSSYTIGLIMFVAPVLFGWAAPYAADLTPGYRGNELTYAVVGDVLVLVSLFVLGGDFWDKLRALLVHGAKAVFPAAAG